MQTTQTEHTHFGLYRQILILAFPIIIENLLQALLGTVDTWFAGKLDDTAIAAIGATTLVVNMFLAFYTAISVGTSAVIARYVGEKDSQKASLAAGQAFLLAVILGGILGTVSLIFRNPILSLSGAEGKVLSIAAPYYTIVAIPSVFACLVLVLSSILRATKDTVTPMLVSGGANILNIVLDAVFLHMGLGIVGLALATTLSRVFSAIILFFRLTKYKNGDIRESEHLPVVQIHLNRACFIPNKKLLANITKIALPAGMEKMFMRIGQLIYNGLIFSISTNAYVAHSVAGTIEYYSYIPAFGFSAAVSTLVGISLGEKDIKKARHMVWRTWICANIIMIPLGFLYFFASPFFAAQFTETMDVQHQVVQVLQLIAFFQPVLAFSNIFAGALQGAGDTKFPMYATFIGTWIVHIGLGYFLGIHWGFGLLGIWIGYAMNNVVQNILLYLRFRSDSWTKIQL